MFGRGYNGIGNCFGMGYGFMNRGLGMIIVAVLIILAVVAVIYFTRKSNANKSSGEAMEILKIKLAKGEITEEEFISRKNTLNS